MAQYKREIRSWFDASDFLRGKYRKKVAHNTSVVEVGESELTSMPIYGILYHKTFVVEFIYGGIYKLNSGGYHTSTTKERINKALPPGFRVFQEDYEWFLQDRLGNRWHFHDNMKIYEKHDGSFQVYY